MVSVANSKWWAFIYTFDRFGYPETYQLGKGRAGGDIYSWDSYKGVNSQGTFRMVLVPHRTIDYLTSFRPNSIVEFWVDNGDGQAPTCGTYLIDRVSQARQAGGDNKVTNRIHISCTDFTKLWMNLSTHYAATFSDTRFYAQNAYTLNNLVKRGLVSMGMTDISRFEGHLTPSEYFLLLTASFFPGIRRDTSADIGSFFDDLPDAFELTRRQRSGISDQADREKLGVDMVVPDNAVADATKGSLHPLAIMDLGNFVAHPETFYYTKTIKDMNGPAGRYTNLWDMVRAQAFPLLNEIFIDTRPEDEIPNVNPPSVTSELLEQNLSSTNVTITPKTQLLEAQGLTSQRDAYFGGLVPEKDTNWAPRVILRKRPYFGEDLLTLPYQHDITDGDISEIDIGISDHDVKNFFKVFARVGGKSMDYRVNLGGMDVAILNPDSIALHGLKMHTPESDYNLFLASKEIPKSKTSAQVIQGTIRRQTETIARWFYRNEELLNGSITLGRMRFDIRVGRALSYKPRGRPEEDPFLFYIESVASRASADGVASTTLGVVRGRQYRDMASGEDSIRVSPASGPRSGKLQFISIGQRIQFRNPFGS